jgi:hypothetical protein
MGARRARRRKDIPDDLTFSTSIPGGDKDLSCSLLRRIDLTYERPALFDQVRVYGPGNKTAWQGRMAQFPRDHGDSFGIAPAAVGLSAHLKDDPAFREIYVDRDLSRWRGLVDHTSDRARHRKQQPNDPSTATTHQRQRGARSGSFHRGVVGGTIKPDNEAVYDAQNLSVGSLYYAWTKGSNINIADTGWSWIVWGDNEDGFSGSIRHRRPSRYRPGTGTFTPTSGLDTFLMVWLQYPAGSGVASAEYAIYWTCLAVYGSHGLTKRGTRRDDRSGLLRLGCGRGHRRAGCAVADLHHR